MGGDAREWAGLGELAEGGARDGAARGGRHYKTLGTRLGLGGELMWYGAKAPRAEER